MKKHLLWVVVLAAAALPLSVGTASGTGTDNHWERPTRWAPTYFATQVENDEAVWGEVAYFIRWQDPESRDGLDLPRTSKGTFEFGIKADSTNIEIVCNQAGDPSLSTAGFPAGSNVQFDWTEDAGDWIVWVGSPDKIQAGNLGDEYVARLDCPTGVDENDNPQNDGWAGAPNLQVQIGHYDVFQQPWNTFSDATLNIIPSEEGWKIRPDGENDSRRIYTWASSPWILNAGFEEGGTSWWTRVLGVWQHITNNYNPEEGNSYLHLRPTSPGGTGHIRQSFAIFTSGNKVNPFDSGNNTGLEFDSSFRCPSWADDWVGQPGSSCVITIRVTATGGSNAGQAVDLVTTIPSNNTWLYVQSSNFFDQDWGQTSGFRVDIFSDWPIDIDSLWLTGDI